MNLEELIEKIQKTFDEVVRTRVYISSNTIELYTLLEQMHCVLLQTSNDDPNFINIVTSPQMNENELVHLTLESFIQEIDNLIEQFNAVL